MVYLDTSVALAQLLAEDRIPPEALWRETLVSSRLLEYETWTRVHGLGLSVTHGDAVRDILARIGFVELSQVVLARATEPFPVPVRTLDALHLSSMEFLRAQHQDLRLATYDLRLERAARRLGIPLAPM